MKQSKDSSSWRCPSVGGPWPAVGAVLLKINARRSSVFGAPGGGLPCILSRAGLVVALGWGRSSAVAGCGGLALRAAPSVRSSCTTRFQICRDAGSPF